MATLGIGTPYTIDWRGWVDFTHFALAGSESDEENSCFGFVRLYFIPENSFTTWNTKRVSASNEIRPKCVCSSGLAPIRPGSSVPHDPTLNQ